MTMPRSTAVKTPTGDQFSSGWVRTLASGCIARRHAFQDSQAFVITVIGAVINILTTLIAIATSDRFGRKPLLIVGSIG